ncbi:DUF6328 family protein [Streptomyces sp. NPDC050546]|uniref:DUF6328 family protein n=1 Tax=Streptomyces sp. NPDC050546 TaxID=3365628 RepID=UPI00378FBD7E
MQVSSRLATTGLIVLVFAFSGSVLLVVDVTTSRAGGIAAGVATFLVCVGLWGVLPRLVRRAGLREEPIGGREEPEPAVGEAAPQGTVRTPAPRRGGASRREASLRRR